MKIAAFGASTSSTSINKQLATYTSSLLTKTEVDVLDMRSYSAPLYSEDEEKIGFPESMKTLSAELKTYDGFILSLAEHNGSFAAAFKNTMDWLSRIDRNIFNDKPMLLMSTSPGARGGQTVLEFATSAFPRMGAKVMSSYAFSSFYDNFKDGKVVNADLNKEIENLVVQFENAL
ncbi:MAG: NADPH-dependent FMN reductase [Flavobacteriales bacterium]